MRPSGVDKAGILFYTHQNPNGDGDFLAVTIKSGGRIQFRLAKKYSEKIMIKLFKKSTLGNTVANMLKIGFLTNWLAQNFIRSHRH